MEYNCDFATHYPIQQPRNRAAGTFWQNVSKFSEALVIYSYFNFHFIFKIQKNGIQTDTSCIKLSYTPVLPVCTDRICVSTFKLI